MTQPCFPGIELLIFQFEFPQTWSAPLRYTSHGIDATNFIKLQHGCIHPCSSLIQNHQICPVQFCSPESLMRYPILDRINAYFKARIYFLYKGRPGCGEKMPFLWAPRNISLRGSRSAWLQSYGARIGSSGTVTSSRSSEEAWQAASGQMELSLIGELGWYMCYIYIYSKYIYIQCIYIQCIYIYVYIQCIYIYIHVYLQVSIIVHASE